LSDILKRNGIAIVACTIKKNGKLDGDGELRIVGLVPEDRVSRDMIEDIIKDLWVDTKFLPKQARAMFLVVNQHVKLRCSWRRLIGLVEYTCPLDLITKSSDGVLEPVVRCSDVIGFITGRIRNPCHRGEGGEGREGGWGAK
jgi:hypothetical protein